jgi:hypothetical protein
MDEPRNGQVLDSVRRFYVITEMGTTMHDESCTIKLLGRNVPGMFGCLFVCMYKKNES